MGGDDRDPGSAYETHTPITIDIDGDTASSSCGQGAILACSMCGFLLCPSSAAVELQVCALVVEHAPFLGALWQAALTAHCRQLSVINFARYLFSVKGIQEHCWVAGFFFFSLLSVEFVFLT